MRSTRGAFWALAVLGGYFIWRNRFAIQHQLSAMGISTPVLGLDRGNLVESARSVAAKTSGSVDRGATIAEHMIDPNKNASNY